MQTRVINQIFSEFIKKFYYFFGPCDRGFINECVINLYSRKYSVDNNRCVIARPHYKLEELIFITRGSLGLFNTKSDGNMPGL